MVTHLESDILKCEVKRALGKITMNKTRGGDRIPAELFNIQYVFSSVQLLSHVWLFSTPWTRARQDSLSFTISQSLLKLKSIDLMMLPNHLILCHSLLFLPSIRVFSNESVLLIRWPKYWSFSFSISPSKEIPGLISFRMDWLDLLADQRTHKNLLQHHNSNFSTSLFSVSNV